MIMYNTRKAMGNFTPIQIIMYIINIKTNIRAVLNNLTKIIIIRRKIIYNSMVLLILIILTIYKIKISMEYIKIEL